MRNFLYAIVEWIAQIHNKIMELNDDYAVSAK
jgi:hypothetical protein